jgi:hypothetical protein
MSLVPSRRKTRRGVRRPGLRAVAAAVGLALMALATAAYAAGGGKPATKLFNVADTRSMAPGLSKFIADVYNQDMVVFGLLVVGLMATMGAVLGFTFDRLFGLLGINLGKLDHHE